MTTNCAPGTAPSPAESAPCRLERDARELHRVLENLLRVVQFRDRGRICCHDISVTQCAALRVLTAAGPIALNDLAESLLLDKSTASRVASTLERKGYLCRRPDPEDGRAVLLEASPAGRELYRSIEEELVEEVRRLVADFESPVRREMTRLLERLTAAAEARIDRGGGCCRLR